MLRSSKLLLALLFAIIASATHPCYAHKNFTYDLATLCSRSTDVIEATLIRRHQPGQEEWNDEFIATVTHSLRGSSFGAGDRIDHLDFVGFQPAQTGQHGILFFNHEIKILDFRSHKLVPYCVDMLLIDSNNYVHRYFQQSNPGGFIASEYDPVTASQEEYKQYINFVDIPIKVDAQNTQWIESNPAEPGPLTLAEERRLISSKWASAKRMRVPLYGVLHQSLVDQTER